MKQKFHLLSPSASFCGALAISALLVGCGGGSDSSSEPANAAPEIVTMTANKTTVDPGGTVTFQGFANDADGDSVNYLWTATEGTLSTVNPKNPVLTVPNSTCDSIQVTLTVTDGKASTSQSILLSVNGGSSCGDITTSSSTSSSSSSDSSSSSSDSSSSSSDSSSSSSDSSSSSSDSSSSSSDSSSSSSDSSSSSSDSSSSSTPDIPDTGNPFIDPDGFASKTDVGINSRIRPDDHVTITGGLEGETITTVNAEIWLREDGAGDFVNKGGSADVSDGDQLYIAVWTGGNYITTYTGSLNIRDYAIPFEVTTEYERDVEPDAFTLNSIEDAELDQTYTSDGVVVTGITEATPATITEGTLHINGVTQTNKSADVVRGDEITIKLQSSPDYDTLVSSTLTLGSQTSTFNVTTKPSTIQIWLTDQRFRKNRPVAIDVKKYLISLNQGDTVGCYFSGEVPSGLSYDESNCSISGTTNDQEQTKILSITAKSVDYGDQTTKDVVMRVADYPSRVIKTGQTDIHYGGDDGNYSDQLGITQEFQKSAFGYLEDTTNNTLWQDNATETLTQEEAKEYCENLSISGIEGWRLPTIEELEHINHPNVDFEYTTSDYYWSITPYTGNADTHWYISPLEGGKTYHINSTSNHAVRCVRGKYE